MTSKKSRSKSDQEAKVASPKLDANAEKAKFCKSLGLDVKFSKYPDGDEEDPPTFLIRPEGEEDYTCLEYFYPDEGDAGKYDLSVYWKKLVPESGDAMTIQGQFGCIYYRFTNEYWRNGLMNWIHQINDDEFRYRGLVEFLEDRLVAEKPFGRNATAFLADILKQLFYQYYPAKINLFQASSFETITEYLALAFYAYNIKHPELIPNDEAEKCKIAESKDINKDVLDDLAKDVSSKVRSAVAKNPLCTVRMLRKLSADRSVQVRLATAKHEKPPIDVIEKLSTDDNVNVRCAAARRKDFPVAKQHDFISAQFALMIPKDVGDSKAKEWFAQSYDKLVLPFDIWKPKMAELLAQLGPEFFLEKLAALLERHVDQRDGTEDALWCCRRILYFIHENKEAPLLSKRLIEKYPNIRAWDDYNGIDELVKIARNRKTTQEELASLIGIDVEIDRQIAKHRNVTAEMRALLSKSVDKITRNNAEKNRNVDIKKAPD